tara:strand:- start:4153 stop:4905 length:753 start_codon:yes stop_codon:yes gene_type:complete
MSLQNEAIRQDKERLDLEGNYYPLLVGLFNKIARYTYNHLNVSFNSVDNLDIDQFRNDFKKILNNLYIKTQLSSYQPIVDFSLGDEQNNTIKNRVNKINSVDNENNIINNIFYILATTKTDIKSYNDSYVDQEQEVSLGEYIANRIKDNASNRSGLISQQNVGIAYESQKHNISTVSALELNNIYDKIWVTMGDNEVRHAHRLADREKTSINNFFIVDDEKLLYPKDMNHGATIGNTINCRCVSIQIKVN